MRCDFDTGMRDGLGAPVVSFLVVRWAGIDLRRFEPLAESVAVGVGEMVGERERAGCVGAGATFCAVAS